VRNLIRENQLHQLENTIQMGRKEGMILMDNCLHDLYCKCLVTYDTAVSRARIRTRSRNRKGERLRLPPQTCDARAGGRPEPATHRAVGKRNHEPCQ